MGKLLQELEAGALGVFPGPSDRDRVKSVLADLAKTASDFRIIASKGLELVANGILPRLRCVLLSAADQGATPTQEATVTTDMPSLHPQASNASSLGLPQL